MGRVKRSARISGCDSSPKAAAVDSAPIISPELRLAQEKQACELAWTAFDTTEEVMRVSMLMWFSAEVLQVPDTWAPCVWMVLGDRFKHGPHKGDLRWRHATGSPIHYLRRATKNAVTEYRTELLFPEGIELVPQSGRAAYRDNVVRGPRRSRGAEQPLASLRIRPYGEEFMDPEGSQELPDRPNKCIHVEPQLSNATQLADHFEGERVREESRGLRPNRYSIAASDEVDPRRAAAIAVKLRELGALEATEYEDDGQSTSWMQHAMELGLTEGNDIGLAWLRNRAAMWLCGVRETAKLIAEYSNSMGMFRRSYAGARFDLGQASYSCSKNLEGGIEEQISVVEAACRTAGFDEDESLMLATRNVLEITRGALKSEPPDGWDGRKVEAVWRRVNDHLKDPERKMKLARALRDSVYQRVAENERAEMAISDRMDDDAA